MLFRSTSRGGVTNENAIIVGERYKVVGSLESRDNEKIKHKIKVKTHWRGSSTGVLLIRREAMEKYFSSRHISLERDFLPRLIQTGKVRAFNNGKRYFIDIGVPERLHTLQSSADQLMKIYGLPYLDKRIKIN